MGSSVRTLSIKCYAEQLLNGWDATKTLIESIDKNDLYVIGICHDKDHNHDDIWGLSFEKSHYHIIVKVQNRKQKAVGTILKCLGVEYRKGLDDSLWDNHGIETVRDFSAMSRYLTHETEQANLDGKTVYSMDELVSNLSREEIMQIRSGYNRISNDSCRYSLAELAILDEQAFALGYELGNFEGWYASQAFAIRANSKMRTIEESYYRGVKKRVEEHTELVRLCVFIKGIPNSGKSYAAEQSLLKFRTLKISGGGSGKFDNLKPYTEAIIVDDDICPNLLNISDNYMTYVYRRNKNNPVWTGKYLVVTSNNSFEDWVRDCAITGNAHIEAVRSRFYICEIRSINGVNKLFCTSPSDRGNNVQQQQRKDMYILFKDAYNDSLKGYVLDDNRVTYDDIND